MQVYVFARMHARPGMREELRDAMFVVQGPTRKEMGLLGYSAFQSVMDPDEFYIHSHWQDQASFDRHAQEPHTVMFVAAVEKLVDHPFKVMVGDKLW
jgi:quinol monooxygenase YgiN